MPKKNVKVSFVTSGIEKLDKRQMIFCFFPGVRETVQPNYKWASFFVTPGTFAL